MTNSAGSDIVPAPPLVSLSARSAPDHVKEPKVLWLSHGYGYGSDLMYFSAIFRGFSLKFRRTKIAMDESYAVGKYPDLPLWPIVRFKRIGLTRSKNGTLYDTDFKLPTIKLFIDVFRVNPDLFIIIEFTPVALVGFVIAKLRRKRVLLLIESDPSFRGAPKGKLVLKLKSLVAGATDLVLTNNKLGSDYLTSVLDIDPNRIMVAPFLTSDPGIYRAESVLAEALSIHREGKINFLFINSITKRKGLAELVRGIALLDKSQQASLMFHIVGDGPELECVKSIIRETRTNECFLFHGRVEYGDCWRFYAAADVFISPTLADYRSLTGFEAILCGKPVLLSRLDGAHAEVVSEGRNGWSFDPRDPEALAKKLTWFIENRDRLVEFSAESHAISKKFSLEEIGSNLAAAARTALAGTGMPNQFGQVSSRPRSTIWRRSLERGIFAITQGFYVPDVLEISMKNAFTRPIVSRILRASILKHYYDKKLIFVHVPRNAGTSVANALYKRGVAHYTASFYKALDPEFYAATPSFAILRDPVDRFLSSYFFVINMGAEVVELNENWRQRTRGIQTLDDFIEFIADTKMRRLDYSMRPQSDFVVDQANNVIVDKLFLLDRDDEALLSFLAPFGVSCVPRLNKAKRGTAELTEKQRNAIHQLYRSDYELISNTCTPQTLGAQD